MTKQAGNQRGLQLPVWGLVCVSVYQVHGFGGDWYISPGQPTHQKCCAEHCCNLHVHNADYC